MGVDLDSTDDQGLIALHHAALGGFEDVVKVLLAAGIDVNATGERHGTPLCVAALRGREIVVEALLSERACVNAPGGWLGSAMHAASFGGSLNLVEKLMEKGASATVVRRVRYRFAVGLQMLRGGDDKDDEAKVELEGQPIHVAAFMGHAALVDKLLSLGACIEATADLRAIFSQTCWSTTGMTPLLYAVGGCRSDTVCLLLSRGANPNASSKTEKADAITALMSAALTREPDPHVVLTALLEGGARPDVQNAHGETALMYAAWRGHVDCVRTLVHHKTSIGIQNSEGKTALHHACSNGEAETVQVLLALGADFQRLDQWGRSAVEVAAIAGGTGRTECVRTLVEQHGSPHHERSAMQGAPRSATKIGREEITRMIVEAGVHVYHYGDKDFLTVLMLVACKNQGDAVRMLITLSADPVLAYVGEDPLRALKAADRIPKDSSERKFLQKHCLGLNAFHMAAWGGHADAIQAFIESGVDIDVQSPEGLTPLMFAMLAGDVETMHMLIKKGVNAYAEDIDGHNVLHLASRLDYGTIVADLLSTGIDINIPDREGLTPLVNAIQGSNQNQGHAIEVLVDHKADLPASYGGDNALELATAHGNSNIVQILKGCKEFT